MGGIGGSSLGDPLGLHFGMLADRVALGESWRMIWEDFVSKRVQKGAKRGAKRVQNRVFDFFQSKNAYKIEVYCFTVTLS